MKRTRMKRKSDRRDWHSMALNAHRNAGGECEVCGKRLPLGTPPAHIIPRSAGKESSDEDWNLALLAYVGFDGCVCHSKFDDHRAKFYQKMLAEEEPCKLLKRILADPRLKEYMDQRLAVWEVKQEQKVNNE